MLNRLTTLFLILLLFGCGGNDCEIRDIEVSIGECNCEDAYSLTLNFIAEGSDSEFFELFARNGELIGYYKLSDLPLTIDKFELSGLAEDYIKIRLNEDEACAKEYEFSPPDCTSITEGECLIEAVEVEVDECLSETEYQLIIDFQYQNPGNEFFDVFVRNNVLLDFFKLSDLPIAITDFQASGLEYDFIKVCINDNPDCCKEIEFMPPECIEGECEIFDLEVEVGECTSENTYNLELNFEYANATHSNYEVFVRNNVRIGNYPLTSLPLELTNFEMSGNDYDFIMVCMSDNPDCCKAIEFMPPECSEGECEIFDLDIEVGDCTSENSYNLVLNFEYANATHSNYEVFVRNNIRIGNYPLTNLPLELTDFEMSGNDYDFIKVCMSDNPDCCKAIEFMPPECSEGECEIFDLVVEVKECTSDSTYNIVLDFDYENPGNEYFDVFIRQGVHFDFFKLSDLPVELIDFPISGNDYDFIKVCINDTPDCCKEAEFMPPEC